MCEDFFFGSPRALITLPRASKPEFICTDSEIKNKYFMNLLCKLNELQGYIKRNLRFFKIENETVCA